ncbi:hypothetical protein HYV91_01065 [Candidatus Wolfebacteria bacterium]|nr:hypothetical protein [Candidatus Wolfebacteria bacterium]
MNFRNLFNLLTPQPQVGGLEVGEFEIRFAQVAGLSLKTASLRLPGAVIEEGKVKDQGAFKKALLDLHAQITPNVRKNVPVILSIPDTNAYAQVFNLPIVAADNLEEAVSLNMQMISPIDYSVAYSDWERLGEVDIGGGQIEILGVFAGKGPVDEYLAALAEAGFWVVAVEFPMLALSRLVASRPAPLLLLKINAGGFSFGVLRDGHLYFNRAVGWSEIFEFFPSQTRVYFKELENILVRETQRVLNFHLSHWQSSVSSLSMVFPGSGLEEKIQKALRENFSLEILPFRQLMAPEFQKMNLASLSSDWYSVLGSALRGLTQRFEDRSPNLSGVGGRRQFKEQQILNFEKFWRSVAIGITAFALLVFIAGDAFLYRTEKRLADRFTNFKTLSSAGEDLKNLEREAQNFNEKVGLALQAKQATRDWSPIIEKIKNLAGASVSIIRIFLQSPGAPIFLTGAAQSEEALLNFKNALSAEESFEGVDLPLSAINRSGSGRIDFSISFKIKNF